MFFNGSPHSRDLPLDMLMQDDLLARRHEWYGAISALIADVFGTASVARARPGPDFHGRGLKVPVSLILDGYLFACDPIDEDDRTAGGPSHTLLVACSALHYGMVGLWLPVERPADIKPAARIFEDWVPYAPESGGVIMANPSPTLEQIQGWVEGWAAAETPIWAEEMDVVGELFDDVGEVADEV